MLLIVARFLSVWAGTPFPVDLVTSDSMHPTLYEGDVVAWTPTNIEDVEIDDVVVFKSYISWPDEKIIVHRVSNITTSRSGYMLLETKGDKNKWTDQQGPHIPEPYIREDHLMGKVISINKFPLKIPFVGIIGIWINQGFDQISQSASAKDSLSYAGIFAPLTISAVILVILIFILPEKAKTIKEKLRLYIIGRKPLNLKKTVISFLIAYIVFLSVIHVFAYDSLTASVGINVHSDDSAGLDFGRIKQNTESFPLNVPIYNPGAMPVKGVVYGTGDMDEFVTKKTFVLGRAEGNVSTLKAVARNNTLNGTYTGDVMIYSSPFWMMFSDELIQSIYNWNAGATVYVLDILTGLILTSITFLLLIGITFMGDKIAVLSIDRSWRHASRIILKKDIVKKGSIIKKKIKGIIGNSTKWIFAIKYGKIEQGETFFTAYGKPMIASLVIIPVIILISDLMTAMIISVILAGLLAYMISCKKRNKIVLTLIITMAISIAHMMIQSNFIILEKQVTTLEILALSFGAIGIYMLIFTLLLVPIIIIISKIIRNIRNVKERKDPLLSLEGSCDL